MTNNTKQSQYKIFERHSQLVLALNSEFYIPENDLVQLTSAQLEKLDYSELYRAYSPRERKSAADVQVIFKVSVYGYQCGILELSRKAHTQVGVKCCEGGSVSGN